MFSTLYLPLVILVSIPLALFAVLTTTLAFSTLLVRLTFVYAELGFALLNSWLLVGSSSSKKRKLSIHTQSAALHTAQTPDRLSSPQRQKGKRSRKASIASSPTSSTDLHERPKKSGSSLSLLGCGTPNRDYEGVGGWRVPGSGDEEALWMGINSRLELPAAIPTAERSARHSNTSVAGPSGSNNGNAQRWSWSPEQIRMSPVQSRVRTPSISGMGEVGVIGGGSGSPAEYFTLQPHGRMSSTRVNEMLEREVGRRRKSGSWESVASNSIANSRRASKVSLR